MAGSSLASFYAHDPPRVCPLTAAMQDLFVPRTPAPNPPFHLLFVQVTRLGCAGSSTFRATVAVRVPCTRAVSRLLHGGHARTAGPAAPCRVLRSSVRYRGGVHVGVHDGWLARGDQQGKTCARKHGSSKVSAFVLQILPPPNEKDEIRYFGFFSENLGREA